MKVNLPDGVTAIISWRHENRTEAFNALKLRKMDASQTMIPVSQTSCHIDFIDKDGQNIGKVGSISKVSPRDLYSKEIGRKLTLKRAVESLSKQTRTALWSAYLGRNEKHS